MMITETVLKAVVYSPFNHLMQLLAGENFIDSSTYFMYSVDA
jgi:hypothetical protein